VLSGVASITEDVDTRNVYRADGSYTFDLLGSHKLRFGYDKEDNKAHSLVQYSGDIRYTYLPYTGGALANNATPPAGTTQVAEVSRYRVGGDFRVITEALYIEDTWKLFSDRLVATAGLRNESFDNRNGQDKSFIKVENQLAPRLAAAFDVKGDGLSKIFGTWGRSSSRFPRTPMFASSAVKPSTPTTTSSTASRPTTPRTSGRRLVAVLLARHRASFPKPATSSMPTLGRCIRTSSRSVTSARSARSRKPA